MSNIDHSDDTDKERDNAAAPAVNEGGDGDDTLPPRLRPEDQSRVDEFLKRGVNSVERKPFKPLYLLFVLIAVVMGLSIFSQWLAREAGVF